MSNEESWDESFILVTKSRKEHTCSACLQPIEKGSSYRRQDFWPPAKVPAGHISLDKLHEECWETLKKLPSDESIPLEMVVEHWKQDD